MARLIAPAPHGARGAALIEMALALPLLLAAMLAVVEFGFLFQRYVVLTNAAVEGARVAVLPGYSATDAAARVRAYAAVSGIPDAATSVQPTVTTVSLAAVGGSTWPGVEVTVRHTYTFQFLAPAAALLRGQFSNSVTLTTRSTMRTQVAGAS